MINKSLTLDFWEKHIRQIEVNQHEKDGRTFAIQCTTGSLPINLSGAAVTFYAQKPDGEVLYNACTITDAATGRITYTMTEQTCAVAGTLKCWIEIIKAGATLRSFEFAVLVRAALDESEAIESTSEFTALETALADVGNVKASITTLGNQLNEFFNNMKIWISPSPVSPAIFLGGVWTRIKDRFLLAAGDTYAAGSTGGAATVTLTANQSGVAPHKHKVTDESGTKGLAAGIDNVGGTDGDHWCFWDKNVDGTNRAAVFYAWTNSAQNALEPHNNMPPYEAVYIWKRTA